MVLLLFVLFLLVPIAELYVIVKAAGAFGIPETILALVGVSLLGAVLVRWQGASLLGRMASTLQRGEVPAKEVVDGVLILFAGALMLTPGFLTDAVGLALLIPPIRLPIRALLIRGFRSGTRSVWISRWPDGGRGSGGVHDVRSEERPRRDDPPTELGPLTLFRR